MSDTVIITSTFDLDETPGMGYEFTYRGETYRAEWWFTSNSSVIEFYDAEGRRNADPFLDWQQSDSFESDPFEQARERLDAFLAMELHTTEFALAEAARQAALGRALRLAQGDKDAPTPEAQRTAWQLYHGALLAAVAQDNDDERFGPQESANRAQFGEHTFLVAVSVEGDVDRETAERLLHREMPGVGHDGEPAGEAYIGSWWIAEDERHDRSDNDSAVFVHPGCQTEATAALVGMRLAR